MKRTRFIISSLVFFTILFAGCGDQDEAENQQKEIRYYIEQLRVEDVFLSTEAAFELAEIGESAVPLLIEALSDEDWQLRLNAVVALDQIGDPTATPALITALSDENWEVRANSTIALGNMGGVAVPALIAALEHKDIRVRRNATKALGNIGDTMAVPGLIGVLSDEDWEVRAGAAMVLGKMGTAAVPALTVALKDEAEYVDAMATLALRLIGTPEALEAIKKNELQKAEEADKNP